MKTLCLKTEYLGKYVSGWLFDDNWIIDQTEKGTGLSNIETKESCFILDLNPVNSGVFSLNVSAPEDWSPRSYYYYPDTETWEKIPQELILNDDFTVEESNVDPVA